MAGWTRTYPRRRRLGVSPAAKQPPRRVEIVKRPTDSSGFIVLPRRWVAERTFSWFGRNRPLAKDYENLADTLAAFITLACIQLALRRLARGADGTIVPFSGSAFRDGGARLGDHFTIMCQCLSADEGKFF